MTKDIARVMEIVTESLDSHLHHTYGKQRYGETKEFHKKCIKEYLEVLNILSKYL